MFKCRYFSMVLTLAHNVFGLYARWRFKALTFNLALMMIEAQMFNLPLHPPLRKTAVSTSPFFSVVFVNVISYAVRAGLLKRNFKYETKSKIQMEW